MRLTFFFSFGYIHFMYIYDIEMVNDVMMEERVHCILFVWFLSCCCVSCEQIHNIHNVLIQIQNEHFVVIQEYLYWYTIRYKPRYDRYVRCVYANQSLLVYNLYIRK